MGAFQKFFGILQTYAGEISVGSHTQLLLHFFVNVFGGIVEGLCQRFSGYVGCIVFIQVSHQAGGERRIGLFLGIQQPQQPVKFALQFKMAAWSPVPKVFQLLKERQEKAWLKGSPDGQHKAVGTIFGIGGFEMDVVVFRFRAWAGCVLTDIFSLDIPFSRMQRGKKPVFGKLKSVFQHKNEDKVSAASGTVVFVDSETLELTVCEIRHGGRGEKNSFHGKPPFFLWKDWK